jgi:hypothetical protein
MAPAEPHDLVVDDDGITGRGDADQVVDVCFDGLRVWSFRYVRDTKLLAGRRVASWPSGLRERLDGTGRVTLREHGGDAVWYDGEVTFAGATGEGTLQITDEQGRSLAVDKLGRLNLLLSDVDTVPLLDGLDRVISALQDGGVHAFLGYGTLLGAVREGAFIAHDHDADVTYLGSAEHPLDAVLESYRLERLMKQRGMAVRRMSSITLKVLVDEEGGTRGLDVFGSFYIDGLLHVMGQIRAPISRDQMLPPSTVSLAGRTFPAPRVPETWLEAAYGPAWRVPDPAFEFKTPRSTVRRFGGWFRSARTGRANWISWYAEHGNAPQGRNVSDFARWVADQEPEVDQIVDACCGVGHDAFWWARQGVSAYGFDFVPHVIRRARSAAGRRGVPVWFDLVNLGDIRSVLAYGAWLSGRSAHRRVLTGRFALDGLSAPSRESMWILCRMLLRGGGSAYFEVLDEATKPVESASPLPPLLRAPALDELAAEISERGGRIRSRTSVPGKGRAAQPARTRLVVTW